MKSTLGTTVLIFKYFEVYFFSQSNNAKKVAEANMK